MKQSAIRNETDGTKTNKNYNQKMRWKATVSLKMNDLKKDKQMNIKRNEIFQII